MARTSRSKPTSPAKTASQLGSIKDTIKDSLEQTQHDTPALADASEMESETVSTKEVKSTKAEAMQKTDKQPSNRRGLPDGWERFTIQTRSEYVDQLKDYAYTERISIRDAADRMFSQFLADKTDLLQRPNK